MKEIIKVLIKEGIDTDMINRVLDVIEEEYDIVNETKKANKQMQQEAKFRHLNPQGAPAYYDKYYDKYRSEPVSKEEKEARKRMTNKEKDGRDEVFGKTHSMKDYRTIHRTDSKDSAPYYDYDVHDDVRSYKAKDVRNLLGRDEKFSNREFKPSKSHVAAQAYQNYKKVLRGQKDK